jgi:hypothetical protein
MGLWSGEGLVGELVADIERVCGVNSVASGDVGEVTSVVPRVARGGTGRVSETECEKRCRDGEIKREETEERWLDRGGGEYRLKSSLADNPPSLHYSSDSTAPRA